MHRLYHVTCVGLLTLLTACSGSVTVDGSNPLEGWDWGAIATGLIVMFVFGAIVNYGNYDDKVARRQLEEATNSVGLVDDNVVLLDIALASDSSASSYSIVSGLKAADAARLAVERLGSLGAIKPLEVVAENSQFEDVRKLAAKKVLILGVSVSEGKVAELTYPHVESYTRVNPNWPVSTGVSILAILWVCFFVLPLTIIAINMMLA